MDHQNKYIITAFAQDTTITEDLNIGDIVQEESRDLLSAIRESSLNTNTKQNDLEIKVLSLSHAVSKLTDMIQKQMNDNGQGEPRVQLTNE